jgi:predicted PolB exonuclease-like 3'-5' exonuclease
MMHSHLICLDIETVQDRELVPPDLSKEEFAPKPIWHRIVAISVMQARITRDRTGERYTVENCRSGGAADWDEARLLRKFWQDYFPACSARIVTWNGRGFDLPVLRARAMMHGISAKPWYSRGVNKWENYTQRFAPDWHCDLMEQLSDYRACNSMKLEEMAAAVGLPGKMGVDGAGVAAMVNRGEMDAVRAYCECDCLNLFGLYVRWGLLSGKLSPEGHDESLRSLMNLLEVQRAEHPHFGRFLVVCLQATHAHVCRRPHLRCGVADAHPSTAARGGRPLLLARAWTTRAGAQRHSDR